MQTALAPMIRVAFGIQMRGLLHLHMRCDFARDSWSYNRYVRQIEVLREICNPLPAVAIEEWSSGSLHYVDINPSMNRNIISRSNSRKIYSDNSIPTNENEM